MHRKSRLINIEVIKRAVKRNEMRGLPRILSLFRDKPDRFNNTGARLLGSIYCMTLKLLFKLRLKIARNYALMLPYNYMRNHYGRHYMALPKFVNH